MDHYTHRIESGRTIVFSGSLEACQKYMDEVSGEQYGWQIVANYESPTEHSDPKDHPIWRQWGEQA